MANICRKYKSFIHAVISITTLLAGYTATAQVTPNTQAYPNATTQTLNPVPSAYASNIALNYIRTWDAEKPFISDTSLSSTARTVQEVKQTTQYVDGLGRPVQTVVKGISPNGYDMVSPVLYDNFGREQYKYLPYISPTNDGNFKNSPFSEQSSFMAAFYNPTSNTNGEKFFYGQNVFEASPLNRALAAYAPGNSWAGSAVGPAMQYSVSTLADSVVVWRISYTQGVTPTSGGYYAYGQLQKNVAVDERGNNVISYTDKDGHVVLKKVQAAASPSTGYTGWLCTYYIYDDLGNLRFVAQPAGVGLLKAAGWAFDATTWAASTIAKEQCFSYEYDRRNRMAIKRVPGAGEVWMVYDARDRMVMAQDSSLRVQGKWLYTDYDSLDRPVLAGLWSSSSNRSAQQSVADTSVTYPSPTSGYTVLTQTYYDDYSWVGASGSGLSSTAITTYNGNTAYFSTAQNTTFPYPQAQAATNLTKGMATGTKVNVVNTTTYLYSVNFYDDRARVLESQSTNYTGGKDTAITQYGFTGRVLNTLVCHGKGGTNPQGYKVLTQMAYDAAGRVTTVTKKTGNSLAVVLEQNKYDELGQLVQKNIGQARNSLTNYTYSSTPLDSLAYAYNIRGWLRGINKDYANAITTNQKGGSWFGMELNYDYGFTQSYLNGNISGTKWRNANDGQQRAYGFTYDAVNRLTEADFTQNAGSNTWNLSAGIDFSAHSISYDANGNILTMNQMGLKVNVSQLIDSLVYNYNTNSNRLNYVTDRVNDTSAHLGDFTEITSGLTQDYWYDGNGNLTKDNNKNIANIHYNYLNLPDSITVAGKGTIKYVYGATGTKLQKIVNDTAATPDKITRTDYAGLFIYQNDTLQYVGTEEGRARPKRANYSDTMYYDYFEKDHLGNTRVVLTDEKQYDVYPAATLEKNTNSFLLQRNFYTINPADTIGVASIASWSTTANRNYPDSNTGVYNNDPYDTSANISKVVYKLNGATGDKTGLGVTLKVMAGDAVNILGKSFWHNSGTVNNGYPISPLLTSFISAFSGTGGVTAAGKGSSSTIANAINNSNADVGSLKYLLDTAKSSTGSVPRAYINWILFDEQFNPVKSGSSFDAVSSTADNVKTHNISVNIPTGGYLYVYCSNESNFDVFFDNLQLVDTRGPLLETDNYYPFGLVQAGISSQAAGKLENKLKYNGKEIQHNEFSNGSGLEEYDFGARNYDPQIGRWFNIDPLADKSRRFSPYVYANNNPIRFVDPDGMTTDESQNGKDALQENKLFKELGQEAKQGLQNWLGSYSSSGLSNVSINADGSGFGYDSEGNYQAIDAPVEPGNQEEGDDESGNASSPEWRLEFQGTAPENDPDYEDGPQLGQGNLSIIDAKTGNLIACFQALSGDLGNGLLPNGTYDVSKPRFNSNWFDETGKGQWSMDIKPTGATAIGFLRTDLEVHPTQKYLRFPPYSAPQWYTKTTEGCIGIIGHDNNVAFKALIDTYFLNKTHTSIDLTVCIDNNNQIKTKKFQK